MQHHHIPDDEKCDECRMLRDQGYDLGRFTEVVHREGYSSMTPRPRKEGE